MSNDKKKLKVYPTKFKDKYLDLSIKPLVFQRNNVGFYSRGNLILKDFDSDNISCICVLNIEDMTELQLHNKKEFNKDSNETTQVTYTKSWYEYDFKSSIVRVKYKNNQYKFFRAKKENETNKIYWYEADDLLHIVYIEKYQNFLNTFSNKIRNNLNVNGKYLVILKSYSNILSALSYILRNDVDLVITENNMKNLSAKNLIKRIRKSKNNIKFIIFTDSNVSNKIEDVEIFKKSQQEELLKRINDFI